MDYFSSLDASTLDPDVPTIFELLSAKQLQDLIPPSLRYILTFYAQRHPQVLLRLANKYDELYLLFMGLIEYYHLKKWNSSFTEKFYGLKRVRVLNAKASNATRAAPALLREYRRLTHTQILGSLFFIIGLPYIKEKLEARYDVLKGRYLVRNIEAERASVFESGTVADKVRFEFDYWLLTAYPYLSMSQSMVTLAFNLGYLFTKTTASSPVDMILGIKYSRLNSLDYQANEPRLQKSIESDQIGVTMKIIQRVMTGDALLDAKNLTLSGLSYVLPTSIFLLKFLEWWYSSDFAHQISKKSRTIGPNGDETLPVPSQDYRGKELPEDISTKGLCPLCKVPITNPAIIETGIAFCYPCVYKHLSEADRTTGGRCPVTGQRLLLCTYSEQSESWNVGGVRRLMI